MNEVILMSDIEGLGLEGDVVRVAEGYARNYLLPRKLAAPVTAATRRVVEKNRKERAARDIADRETAERVAAAIGNASCTIAVKTSAEGKLYGSVHAAQIAEALKEQGVEIGKGKIELPEPIKELGVFDLAVRLHRDVKAPLKVWVVEE